MDTQIAKITRKILSKQYKTHYHKMLQLKREIDELDKIIVQNCGKSEQGHEWVTEREQCMYGEKFTRCKKCNIDFSHKWVSKSLNSLNSLNSLKL